MSKITLTNHEYQEIYRCVMQCDQRVQDLIDACEDHTMKTVWQEQTNAVMTERYRILQKLQALVEGGPK